MSADPRMKHPLPLEEAVAKIPDGASILFGGFMGVGSAKRLVHALAQSDKGGFTIIGNDTSRKGRHIGELISAGKVKKVVTSHIGLNPETQAGMIAGTIEVELVPQGSLAERIRAGGAGLGGVLTRTGLGTRAAEGKQVVHVNGEDWLIEPALRADVALINAHQADYYGNLVYQLTATNFNPIMAMAADLVIAEVGEVVPVGMLPPDLIKTPGVLVDVLVRPEM